MQLGFIGLGKMGGPIARHLVAKGYSVAGFDVDADAMTLVSVSSILHMAQTHLVFRCHLDDIPATTATGEARELDRKSTRLNSSHMSESRMPSSA